MEDPLATRVVGPYRAQAATELAGTRFATLLTEECQAHLLDWLCQDLCSYARSALDALVARQLARSSPLWAAEPRLVPKSARRNAQVEACEGLCDGMGDALDDVAPLLRAELGRQVGRFVFALSELCDRIWRDRDAILALMAGGADSPGIGQVTGVDLTRGDPHNGGRRTCVVACEAGRFVYKPHDCRIDRWLADVAEAYLPGALRQPSTITRADGNEAWAFQEFVRREPVTDEAGVGRYWRNMGRAAALFQALGSEDLHFENFVAAGERPSLVDAEMVLAGTLPPGSATLSLLDTNQASTDFGRSLSATIASSSLLSGLLERGHNVSPLYERGASCLPVWECEERDVLGYERELLAGLDEGLSTLALHANGLSRDVRAAADLPVRRMFRSTHTYGKALARLKGADAFRPEVRRRLLASLERVPETGGAGVPSPLLACEAAGLAAGDVPYFWHRAASRAVVGAGGATDERLLAESAVERALGRIAALDEGHRPFVCAVVGLSMRQAQVPTGEPLPACAPTHAPLGPDEALAEADGVLGALEDLLVTAPSGERSWLFRRRATGCLERTSACLADGLGGMAVFLAALATRSRDSRACQAALLCLEDCLHGIDDAVSCLESSWTISGKGTSLGMTDGLGGLVRCLDLVSRSLDRTDAAAPLRTARSLLDRLLEVAARADVEHATSMSVYAGGAGLLLAIAQCGRARARVHATLARRLVDRLLAQRTLSSGGRRLWDTIGIGRPVSGFGNGQAGIGAALAAATSAFGADEFAPGVQAAMLDALAWEFSCYRESIGTWPDLRRESAPGSFLQGICSGAPGVGLAALVLARSSADEVLRRIADRIAQRADTACRTLPPGSRDRLCCGTISLAEYLVSRGHVDDAGRILGGVVGRSHARGGYTFSGAGIRRTDEPDLLTGLAGVGYGLLRYADPTLPGVFVD